eukprot:8572857-Pyramimonas_sp.AAC.1
MPASAHVCDCINDRCRKVCIVTLASFSRPSHTPTPTRPDSVPAAPTPVVGCGSDVSGLGSAYPAQISATEPASAQSLGPL